MASRGRGSLGCSCSNRGNTCSAQSTAHSARSTSCSSVSVPPRRTVGDLVEGIALHAFEGKAPFTPDTLAKIEQLKAVYGLSLTAADAHKLEEKP